MFNIRGWEWIIILAIVLIIFGPSKLPNLARTLGKTMTAFRTGVKEAQDDIEGLIKETEPKSSSAPPPPKPVAKTESTEGTVKDNGLPPEPDYPEDA